MISLHTPCRKHDSETNFYILRGVQFPNNRQWQNEHGDIGHDVRERRPSIELIYIEAVTTDDSLIPQVRKRTTHEEAGNCEGKPISNQKDGESPAANPVRRQGEYPEVNG